MSLSETELLALMSAMILGSSQTRSTLILDGTEITTVDTPEAQDITRAVRAARQLLTQVRTTEVFP